MSENKTNSSPNKLSEELPRLIEERKRHLRQKYGENVPYWETSLAELKEMNQEQQEALLEKSLRDYPEEGKQFLSDQADLWDMAKEAALATSEWPAFPKERLYENPFAEGVREAWEFYRRIMKEDEVKGWNLLKEHEQWYSEQIEAAEKEREEAPIRELRRRIYMAKVQYFIKRRVLRRFTRRYMMFLTVPGELSQEEAKELSGVLPIPGYHAAEYVKEACDILDEKSGSRRNPHWRLS